MILLAFMDSRLLLTSALLVGALLLGAMVIAVVRRWQQMSGRGGMTANEQLAQFRALYERGELSEAEFRRLRDLLSGQIRHESGLTGDRTSPRDGSALPRDVPPPPEGGITP